MPIRKRSIGIDTPNAQTGRAGIEKIAPRATRRSFRPVLDLRLSALTIGLFPPRHQARTRQKDPPVSSSVIHPPAEFPPGCERLQAARAGSREALGDLLELYRDDLLDLARRLLDPVLR